MFCTTADGSTVANEGENVAHVEIGRAQLRHVTFQVASVNMAPESVPRMVKNGNRVVFDTSTSSTVHCGHDGSTARKITEDKPTFGRRGMCQGQQVRLT